MPASKDWQPFEGGFCETKCEFYINGKLIQTEIYHDIRPTSPWQTGFSIPPNSTRPGERPSSMTEAITQLRQAAKPLHLAAVIFLTVSGGPYGLEQLFAATGTSRRAPPAAHDALIVGHPDHPHRPRAQQPHARDRWVLSVGQARPRPSLGLF